jgi:hypothetical protein
MLTEDAVEEYMNTDKCTVLLIQLENNEICGMVTDLVLKMYVFCLALFLFHADQCTKSLQALLSEHSSSYLLFYMLFPLFLTPSNTWLSHFYR